MDFVNLYIKTEYSMLASSCAIDALTEKLVKYGYHAAAMCDEGNIHGALKFYQSCSKKNLKPIIGLRVIFSYNDQSNPILLYASNMYGYKNLMKIATRSKIMNNEIDFEYLSNNAIGLIAIIPFHESRLSDLYLFKKYPELIKQLELIKNSFPKLYIGLNRMVNKTRSEFQNIHTYFAKNHYQMVALPEVCYINEEDVDIYKTLILIGNGGNEVQYQDGYSYGYLQSKEDLYEQYQLFPDLINNTKIIANNCNINIEFGKQLLPKYQDGLNANTFLKELCKKGLDKRLSHTNNTNREQYLSRLHYELEVIEEMGFSDYFLIVYDYVKYAKQNQIYVGPGRGSAPASLVSYTLGITDVDPIKYNLLFERFLNRERITLPDIDIDFPDDERDQVIKYIGEKYGTNRVAHIVTFGTFKAKIAIRDCARVYKLNNVRLNQIIKCVNETLKVHRYSYPLIKIIEENEELQQLINNYEDIEHVVKIASCLEGLPRNISTHAAGIIITQYDLVNYTALDNGLNGIYQTQYDASDLESLGLLKMDLLGLRNLSNISKTLKLIKKEQPDFKLPTTMNDLQTYQMLASGDVAGVFQLESDGIKKVIMDLKTSTFEDLTVAIALYRPGPMEIIPTYIKRKFKQEVVVYPHDDLKNILEETYGTIVYQEQIMLIATTFAGYSLGKSDILRRAVSKKDQKVLESERSIFVNASVEKGYKSQIANQIYDYIVKFGNYGFNKAHSVAYAQVAYQTAYLKQHFLPYYLATLMSSIIGSDRDLDYYHKEMIRKKIPFEYPNINMSSDEFFVDNSKIIFPLSIIKGLGTVKTKLLLEETRKGIFTSYEDFVQRTKDIISTSLVENIIYSGALDCFGITKKAMIDNYQNIINRFQYEFIDGLLEYEYHDEEYTYGWLLDKEKEVLGVNLKYSFLHRFSSLITEKKLTKILDIKDQLEVGTIGVIKKIKEIKTKNNDNMAFISLEDDTSTIEVVVFPNLYQRFHNLKAGHIVIVYGKTQQRNTIQVLANNIEII